MSSLFQIMNMVREEIMETFTIPGLGISYWKFCIYLLVVGVVVAVLVNGVSVSAGILSDSASESDRYKRRKLRRDRDYPSRRSGRWGG